MMQVKRRYLIVIFVFSLLMFNQIVLYAAGSGGVEVTNGHICLDGAVITGAVTVQEALHRPYRAVILRGHVGSGDPLVSGQFHSPSTRLQAHQYRVRYPQNTFTLGEDVTLSILASDQSGHGGGIFTTVENCTISDFVSIPDNRNKPMPQWVSFAPDTDVAHFQGQLSATHSTDYMIYANQGETLIVDLYPENKQAILAITGMNNGTVLLTPSAGQTRYTGTLQSTQSYLIRVLAGSSDIAYTLDIQIPWELSADGNSLYQRKATNHTAFINQLQQIIENQNDAGMWANISESFAIYDEDDGGQRWETVDVMIHFRAGLLPETANIDFPEDISISEFTIAIDLGALFPDAYSYIYSRGWGIDGNIEAILVIKEDPETQFIWDGILISDNGLPIIIQQPQLLIAPTSIPPTAVPQPTLQPAPIVCNYRWFFIPAPTDCAGEEARVSNATAQYFERGTMIWLQNTDYIYTFYAYDNIITWFAQSNTWVAGMPDTTSVDTPPAGFYLPIRGFGLVWQENDNRQHLGWATSQEFPVQVSIQCDDKIRTEHCYMSAPNGLIEFGGQGLWRFWGA